MAMWQQIPCGNDRKKGKGKGRKAKAKEERQRQRKKGKGKGEQQIPCGKDRQEKSKDGRGRGWLLAIPGLKIETWGTLILQGAGKDKSRFPAGMTDRETNADPSLRSGDSLRE
jgi:hypothetical protein